MVEAVELRPNHAHNLTSISRHIADSQLCIVFLSRCISKFFSVYVRSEIKPLSWTLTLMLTPIQGLDTGENDSRPGSPMSGLRTPPPFRISCSHHCRPPPQPSAPLTVWHVFVKLITASLISFGSSILLLQARRYHVVSNPLNKPNQTLLGLRHNSVSLLADLHRPVQQHGSEHNILRFLSEFPSARLRCRTTSRRRTSIASSSSSSSSPSSPAASPPPQQLQHQRRPEPWRPAPFLPGCSCSWRRRCTRVHKLQHEAANLRLAVHVALAWRDPLHLRGPHRARGQHR